MPVWLVKLGAVKNITEPSWTAISSIQGQSKISREDNIEQYANLFSLPPEVNWHKNNGN